MKNKKPNKRVQRTLHKVSGPLTRDVRVKNDDPGVTLTGWSEGKTDARI